MKLAPLGNKLACALSRKQLLIVIPLSLYVVFEAVFVLPLPLVGVHAWNESTYLTMVNYLEKTANPFLFRAAYDPFRPDYNVGYLFYWASYTFHQVARIFFSISLEDFLFLSRIFSLIATSVSSILIYDIVAKLSGHRYYACLAATTFLFSPLILHFGARFQLEPFTFLVFLCAWRLIIRYRDADRLRDALLGFAVLGALVATRQIFAIYVPALLFTSISNGSGKRQNCARVVLVLSILALVAGFTFPLILTQLAVPEYAPLKFQFARLMESPKMAFSTPGPGNLAILYFQNSLLPSLGFSFLLVLPLVMILFHKPKRHLEAIAFFLGGLIYFIFAFQHNIVHMYHSYYFLPAIILGFVFTTNFVLRKRRKRFAVAFLVFLMVSSVFSIWETVTFYGVGSARIYRDVDPYGNLDSVFAGRLINRFHQLIKNRGLLDENITYYSLVQSPAVYFYEEMPTISYYDFFVWNEIRQEYEGFNFFSDQESFLQAVCRQNLFILTITPDVYAYGDKNFYKYVQENFAFIASEGVHTFYLNQTIFSRDPAFCKKNAFVLVAQLEDSQIAPASLIQTVLNMSDWYRITNRTILLDYTILNEYPRTFFLQSEELNDWSLTLEISLVAKHWVPMGTIVSLDDIVNVKYGNSDDVYLELTSTASGYRWFSGVDLSKYMWQNLTLTFVYDANASRAETYFNGVLMSAAFRGADGSAFPPVLFQDNHAIKTSLPSDVSELYSIKLWNRALTYDEVGTTRSLDSEAIFLSASKAN